MPPSHCSLPVDLGGLVVQIRYAHLLAEPSLQQSGLFIGWGFFIHSDRYPVRYEYSSTGMQSRVSPIDAIHSSNRMQFKVPPRMQFKFSPRCNSKFHLDAMQSFTGMQFKFPPGFNSKFHRDAIQSFTYVDAKFHLESKVPPRCNSKFHRDGCKVPPR